MWCNLSYITTSQVIPFQLYFFLLHISHVYNFLTSYLFFEYPLASFFFISTKQKNRVCIRCNITTLLLAHKHNFWPSQIPRLPFFPNVFASDLHKHTHIFFSQSLYPRVYSRIFNPICAPFCLCKLDLIHSFSASNVCHVVAFHYKERLMSVSTV